MGYSAKEGETERLVRWCLATAFVAVVIASPPCQGGERLQSWSQRATEACDEALRSLEQYDLVGAAAAQADYVEALAHLYGHDHPQTRWEAAFAHEWREVSQLSCDRQYAYIESLHLLFAGEKRAEADPASRLADIIDALVILEPLREDHSFTALFALVEMGDLARGRDDHDSAIDFYMEALNGLAATCGADHPHATGILERLASTYASQGQHREAERWIGEALEIYRQGDAGDTAFVGGLVKLAAIHMARENLAEAEGLLVWARKLSEKRSVRGDALKGEIRFALAYVLARHGNYQESAEMLSLARHHFDKLTEFREHHLERIDQLSHFLEAHAAAGTSPSCEFPQPGMLWEEVDGELLLRTPTAEAEKSDDASATLDRLKMGREKLELHLECAEFEKVVALQRGRVALIEASPLKQQPVATYEKVLLEEWEAVLAMQPDDQVRYARSYTCLGLGGSFPEGDQSDRPSAEDCLVAAIAELESLGFDRSIQFALACRQLSCIHSARRDYATALEQAKRARGLIEAHYGPNDPHNFGAIDMIVRLHVLRGELDAGERLFRESLPEARRVVRMNSPEYVGLLISGAMIHTERGRLAEAEGMCRQAIELTSRLLEKSPILEAECEFLLAHVHLAHGDLREAEAQFAKVWRFCQSPAVRCSPVAFRVVEGHVKTLVALGRDTEAVERLTELKEMGNK